LKAAPTFPKQKGLTSMPRPKTRGKFWPHVRALIWEKAQELYQMENAKTMKEDFKGTTATRKELREGGYFQTAKLIILREIWLQKKDPSILEKNMLQTNDKSG
jgi:hypothetical protein